MSDESDLKIDFELPPQIEQFQPKMADMLLGYLNIRQGMLGPTAWIPLSDLIGGIMSSPGTRAINDNDVDNLTVLLIHAATLLIKTGRIKARRENVAGSRYPVIWMQRCSPLDLLSEL